MANSIGWGQVYCYSNWGDEANKLSVPEFPEFCDITSEVCGVTISHNDGITYPERYKFQLAHSGVSTLTYEAYGIPDKWIIIQDGNVILDTGYRGDAGLYQAGLNAALAERGLPPETIQGAASGSANFTVSSLSPIFVYVYAPMESTAFQTNISCIPAPGGYTPPTNLTYTEVTPNLEYKMDWVNTAFTGTIETIQIWVQKEGLPNPNIIPVAFDPNKPTTSTFSFLPSSSPGNYTVRVQYSDPTNGLSGFSNTVSFSTT